MKMSPLQAKTNVEENPWLWIYSYFYCAYSTKCSISFGKATDIY